MNEKCIVHGAAGSIGSSCIEIIIGKHHIILDYGKPLTGESNIPFEFPTTEKARSNFVVIISHSHSDHAGFINSIPDDIPVFMTELTERALLLNNKENITRDVSFLHGLEIVDLSENLRFVLFPMNHSAPDACGVLIANEDKVFLYTGDFRNHGYGADSFLNTIHTFISSVFGFSNRQLIVISEATNIGIKKKEQIKETDLWFKFAREFKKPGLIMIKMSNQNVERIASILTAIQATGRILVSEPYTALCAKELTAYIESSFNLNSSVYNLRPDGKNWRVFNIQTRKTEEIATDKKLYQFGGKYKISKEEIEENKDRIVIIANTDTERYLERKGIIDRVIWSMWTGYEGYTILKDRYPISVIHSSGHVFVEDWINTIKTLSPKKTILIHTQHPDVAAELIKDLTVPVVAEMNREITLD